MSVGNCILRYGTVSYQGEFNPDAVRSDRMGKKGNQPHKKSEKVPPNFMLTAAGCSRFAAHQTYWHHLLYLF